MPATLRLMRHGKKGNPIYRIVAIDKRKKRETTYLENLGSYEPLNDPAKFIINKEKFESWISKGAQVSEGLAKLLKNKKLQSK